jgi:hypothetical protein
MPSARLTKLKLILGSPITACLGAVAALATPWICAYLDISGDHMIWISTLVQSLWMVIWVQRCKALWETSPARRDRRDEMADAGYGYRLSLRTVYHSLPMNN